VSQPRRSLILPALFAIAVIGGAAYSVAAPADEEVTFVKVTYEDLLARIAANKGAKLTVVDAWATWCTPCKENFPHVVEMHKKYARHGLAVVSLSLDDPDQPKRVAEAKAFLTEKGATFPNYYLSESSEAAFEKLNITGIPAVFLYGPDGKEVKRFSFDDPDHPFTYDQVEAAIKERLGVK
jgi:thiol-disulfide isomerase/thioredoxin